MMFDMEYLSKSKAPSSPKPSGTAKRPVLGRKRDTAKTSKVVNLEEFCARVVVDDLIQGALKDDARNAAEDLFFDEDEFPELVEKYDDYDEDDVVSLAGQSDSDEEELENFNLVCQVTKRAVKGALQDDFHGIDFGKAVEDASRDASTEDSTDGFCEVVDLSDEEVDSEGDGVPQTDIAPEAAPVKESVATSPPKFHMLPSVGTWMVPSFRAPVTPVPAAPESSPVKESVATSPPKFHMLPSVGTWMVPSCRAPVAPVPAATGTKVLESELQKLLACSSASHLQVHAAAGLKLLYRRKKRAGNVPPTLTPVPLAEAMQEVEQDEDLNQANAGKRQISAPASVKLTSAEACAKAAKVSLQANAWRHTSAEAAAEEAQNMYQHALSKVDLNAEAPLMMRREARGSLLLAGDGSTQSKWPPKVINLFQSASQRPHGCHLCTAGGTEIGAPEGWKLVSGFAMKPDPEKAATGGEDSLFICPNGSAAGVADGVGSMHNWGIDPKPFADELMATARESAHDIQNEVLLEVDQRARVTLRESYEAAKQSGTFGSSTCLVALVDPNEPKLGVANLGDSGLRILRWSNGFSGKPRGVYIAERTSEQQHAFNTPYQLSFLPKAIKDKYEERGVREDLPSDCQTYTFKVREGDDVVLLGTDGIFDNLHDWEICELATVAMEGGDPIEPKKLAHAFAEAAFVRSQDTEASTPFQIHARNHGFRMPGGKMDDITVVACVVTS